MADTKRDQVSAWGLAGSILNLAGVLLLGVTAIGGEDIWRLYLACALIGVGGLCTLKAFHLRRRLLRDGPSTEDPRAGGPGPG